MKQLCKCWGGVIVSIILMLVFFTVGCELEVDNGPTSYTITVADSIEHGSVTASPTKAAAGASVTLTVTPADGYELEAITVRDVKSADVAVTQDTSDKSKYTFTMPESNVTVSATFTVIPPTTYTVTVASTIEHGTVSASPTTAAAGASVTLTATPADGYELEAITVKDANSADVAVTQDTSNKSKYTFTMPESNVTVSATFTVIPPTTYTVTVASTIEHGSVSASPTTAAAGAKITLSATPESGYELSAYSVTDANGSAVTVSNNSFTMPESNVTVSATFTVIPPTTYTVTVASTIEHGSVSASPTAALAGASITLTVTPDDGYELKSITIKDSKRADVTVTQDTSDNSKYTFTMPESNVDVSATFAEPASYIITVADSIEHGSVSASPTAAVAGTSITLTVTPDDGYELVTISVKDANNAAVQVTKDSNDTSKYTFTMPESNVTVSAIIDRPLTLKALTAGTIVVNSPKSGMQYSLNGGEKTAVTSEAITVAEGDTVAFYGNGKSITNYQGTNIAGGTAEVKVYGKLMSLVDETGFATYSAGVGRNMFEGLFKGYTSLKDAAELVLPAKVGVLCYRYMFEDCTGLTTAPELPATELYTSCYNSMFKGCTSLTTAPELPATTLNTYCYSKMFLGCSSLTTAPELPALTLKESCYEQMFEGCSSLNAVTCLATDTNANSTYNWLKDVAASGTFTTPSSTSWDSTQNGIHGIPSGWTRVDAN